MLGENARFTLTWAQKRFGSFHFELAAWDGRVLLGGGLVGRLPGLPPTTYNLQPSHGEMQIDWPIIYSSLQKQLFMQPNDFYQNKVAIPLLCMSLRVLFFFSRVNQKGGPGGSHTRLCADLPDQNRAL